MDILIHVGRPKTGSTTIQALLRRNTAVFEQAGIASFVNGRAVNALNLACIPNAPKYGKRRDMVPKDVTDFAAFQTAFREELIQELQASKSDKLILTNEGLSGLSKPGLENLKQIVTSLGGRPRIVMFVRRQDEAHVSWLKNQVRNRGLSSLALNKSVAGYNHNTKAAHFEEVFGRDAVRVLRFPGQDNDPRDLIARFMDEVDDLFGPLDAELEIPERQNASWDRRAVQFMTLLNGDLKSGAATSREWRDVVRYFDDYPVTEKFQLDRGAARAFMARYEESNEALRARYFPDDARLFNNDYSHLPREPLPDLTPDEIGAIVRDLMRLRTPARDPK